MGGHAIKCASSIDHSDIVELYYKLKHDLKVQCKIDNIVPLGSVMKKRPNGIYGDIDIGLKYNWNNIDELVKCISKHSSEVKLLKGSRILSFAYYYRKLDKFVQIDLIILKSLEWGQFYYHSPFFFQSKYKGLYRNILLFNIARNIEYFLIEGTIDNPVTWMKWTISPHKGLIRQTQSYKRNNKIYKTKTTINEKSFVNSYGPFWLIEMFFGKEYTVNDISTFESCLNILKCKTYKHKQLTEKIISDYIDDLKSQNLEIPEELK